MSECVAPRDEVSPSLTTTVNASAATLDTLETDEIKSEKTAALDNCHNEKDDFLMKNATSNAHSGKPTYLIIDGKKVRSALSVGSKKSRPRRVSFPTNDKELITGYLEPANPWEHAEDVSRDVLISSYKESCQRHRTEPLKKVLDQLETLDIHNDRCDELCLKHESLERKHCEPLEEILKRVQFKKIDLEASELTDESAEIMFDMVEYYESAKHVNISSNGNIGTRGWQACSQMIKKTLCLEQLDAKSIVLTQQHMNILKRPLQLVSHLQILKVENCGLAGRAFVILVAALKLNTGLKELYLADNRLEQQDAIQLGALLGVNTCLQLLDISNNNIHDDGVHNILDGLISQSNEESRGDQGLKILILWNNHLTKNCAPHFAAAIAQSKTLETLNIGHNGLSDDFLDICKDALKSNKALLQLGVQATGLMNKGIMALAEVVGKNTALQRIDLRDNHIQLTGLTFLCLAMKKNTNVTQIDLDPKTWSKSPSMSEQYEAIVSEIRVYCTRNEEIISTDSSTEESGSPQHRSRLSSVNSRKISLTCQTLPRSSSVPSGAGDTNMRTSTLEPKRTTGGRLRSPAPSPIPSPVASPIPSPSRGRFVVCRVSEASLSSTNSSTSSSPITPPSLASSPTCFFPTTSGSSSSRFRVTVVEPTTTSPSRPVKNVITSANTNVTIGFNYRIDLPDRTDSDDSDSVFRSETDEDSRHESESSADVYGSFDEHIRTPDSGTVFDVDTAATQSTRFPYNSPSLSDEDAPKTTAIVVKPEKTNTSVAIEGNSSHHSSVYDERVGVAANRELNVNNQLQSNTVDNSATLESPKIIEVPKQSSLERLLGLFHHPGSLFTGSFVDKAEVPLKNPLQGSVNSMMLLGDKFQQYLRDTTRHTPLQRSASDATRSSTVTKNDPIKSLSVEHLSSMETNSLNSNREILRSKPEDSVDNIPIAVGRLSEVQEVEAEHDNPKIDTPLSVDDKDTTNAAQMLTHENSVEKFNNNDSDNDNDGEMYVPVLTFKSEYSIMINENDGVTKGEVNTMSDTHECVKTICDNGTKDSINTLNLKDTSVFPVVDYQEVENTLSVNNLLKADNVHNNSIGENVSICNGNDDESLMDNTNCPVTDNNEMNSSILDSCCNDNHNQGNENGNAQYLTVEEEVKEILMSILNVIPSILDSTSNDTNVCTESDEKLIEHITSENFIDFNVDCKTPMSEYTSSDSCNCTVPRTELGDKTDDILRQSVIKTDFNSKHEQTTGIVHVSTIINKDNVVLKISNTVPETPILADDLISSVSNNCQNLASSSSSITDELDNPQTSRSPTNLLIDKSRSIHRNSQDSGIEEANISISDDNLEISLQPRDSFQESVDSGIDSECSSVYAKIELIQSSRDSSTEDTKFYDIPEINAHELQSISSKTLMIEASVFVNNRDSVDVQGEIATLKDSQLIGDTDITIIGAKTTQEEHVVNTCASVE